jgi:hypothetical protein
VIRRLQLSWDDRQASSPTDRPTRFLAVSDERVGTLDEVRNREALMPLDAILGCGDLEPDYVGFLADAFGAPLLYVRGNHDRDAGWGVHSAFLPDPLDSRTELIEGIAIAGFSWPGKDRGRAERDGTAAWWQAVSAVARAKLGGRRPDIENSHVPPRGHREAPDDEYPRGFSAYHWLCRTLDPRLWLHGHTTAASTTSWRTTWGTTTLVTVTGGVLIEIERGRPGQRQVTSPAMTLRPDPPSSSAA